MWFEWVLWGGLAVLALLLGVYVWWVRVHYRFTTIARGRVYQAAAMPLKTLLAFIRTRRIDTVIDFRTEWHGAVEREAHGLSLAGFKHIHLPATRDPTMDNIQQFIACMDVELAAGRRVLLHCQDGEGRAVMFAAIYRMQFENWTPDDAYLATARLPDGLRFLCWIYPRLACLSPRNVKTNTILEFKPLTGANEKYLKEDAIR